MARITKYTMGIIIAITFSLFMLGLMIMSAMFLVAYVRSM